MPAFRRRATRCRRSRSAGKRSRKTRSTSRTCSRSARVVAIPFFVWLLDTPDARPRLLGVHRLHRRRHHRHARRLPRAQARRRERAREVPRPAGRQAHRDGGARLDGADGAHPGVGRRPAPRPRDQRHRPSQRRGERGRRHQRRAGGEDEDRPADDRHRRAGARLPVPPVVPGHRPRRSSTWSTWAGCSSTCRSSSRSPARRSTCASSPRRSRPRRSGETRPPEAARGASCHWHFASLSG